MSYKSFALLAAASFLAAGAGADPIHDWTYRYDSGKSDLAKAMAVDRNGNTYLAGRSTNANGNYDAKIVKVSPTGAFVWERTFGNATENDDLYDICIDGNQNVIVTGYSSANVNVDVLIAKYSPSGTQAWLRTFNGAGNSTDVAYAAAVDAFGTIYVGGKSRQSGGKFDALLAKYNSAGTKQWAQAWNTQVPKDNVIQDVAIDRATGLIYGAGYFAVGDSPGLGFRVFRPSDGSGNVIVHGYPNPDALDTSEVRTLGGRGPVYVGTFSPDPPQIMLAAMQKVDPGTLGFVSGGWLNTYNPAPGPDRGIALEIDAAENTYVAGSSFAGPQTGIGMVVRKINPTGGVVWTTRHDENGNGSSIPSDITVDAYGFVYVAGYSNNIGTGSDFVIFKLALNGAKTWTDTYVGPKVNDIPVGITARSTGDVIVGGTSAGTNAEDFVVRKYHQDPVANNDAFTVSEEVTNNVSDVDGLLRNDYFHPGSTVVLVQTPTHGTLTMGAGGAFDYKPDSGYKGPDTFTYKLLRGSQSSNTATVTITVGPMGAKSLAIVPATVVGGKKAIATVATPGPAPAPGVPLDITDNSTALSEQASVTVATGATTANFDVITTPVSTSATRSVTVSRAGTVSKSANITLTPGGFQGFTFTASQASVTGGQPTSGLVVLTGPAAAGGVVVALTTNSSSMTVPPTLTLAAGESSKTLQVTTTAVTNQALRTITGKWEEVTKTQTISLNPPSYVVSLTLVPSTVKGGTNSTATVTISVPAPAGGAQIVISESDNLNIVSEPASVTVPAGSTSTTFTVTTQPTGVPGFASITAKAGNTKTANLTINP